MDSQLFTPEDLSELQERGISLEEATLQVEEIRRGFPYLEILASASLEQGILHVEHSEEVRYMDLWEEYLLSGKASVYKMVPASGAASRMFKMLFAFLDAPYTVPEKPAEELFFSKISQFAFYERLNEACLRNNWKSIPKLIAAGEYKAIVENLLLPKGLGYGSKPKALLLFHNYKEGARTSAEEHLVEGALYAKDREGDVRLHFTVSPEHRKESGRALKKLLADGVTTGDWSFEMNLERLRREEDPRLELLKAVARTLEDGDTSRLDAFEEWRDL